MSKKIKQLFIAIDSNDTTKAIKLLDEGVDINSRIPDLSNWSTVIQCAANNNNTKLMKYLIDKGCDIHKRDGLTNTTLMFTIIAQANATDAARLLIKHGCDVNETTLKRNRYFTALHWCASEVKNSVDVAKILIENNCDLNLQDIYGYTPLIEASVVRTNIPLFRLLIEEGADLTIKDKKGRTYQYYIMKKKKYYSEEKHKKIIHKWTYNMQEAFKIRYTLFRQCIFFVRKNYKLFNIKSLKALPRDIRKYLYSLKKID